MSTSVISNEKPAAATDHGRLILVSTTTPRPQHKDAINDFLYDDDDQV